MGFTAPSRLLLSVEVVVGWLAISSLLFRLTAWEELPCRGRVFKKAWRNAGRYRIDDFISDLRSE